MKFLHITLCSLLSLITITSTSYSQDYDVQFHDEKNYSDAVPSPDELLGYRLGEGPARYNEIVNYIKTVADRSDRAILDARLDREHWLTFGLDQDNIPVFFASSYAVLSEDPVQTPVRLESAERIRLGGLLWPEAWERWAETAFVTREKSGKGQIILFAQEANFRAYFLGSGRLMLNALFLGPGMGTSWPAPW